MPMKTEIESFIHSMQCVLNSPGNFIGPIDLRGETLQFYYNDDSTITLDIPKPSRGGSFSINLTLGRCVQMVRGLGDGLFEEQITGLKFNPFFGDPAKIEDIND